MGEVYPGSDCSEHIESEGVSKYQALRAVCSRLSCYAKAIYLLAMLTVSSVVGDGCDRKDAVSPLLSSYIACRYRTVCSH